MPSWGFTAVLGTPQCRLANIVLATRYNAAIQAAAVLDASAALGAHAHVFCNAEAAFFGQATFEGHANAIHRAFAEIFGISELTAHVRELLHADIVGDSDFFIDPAAVRVYQVFFHSTVPTAFQQTVRPPQRAVPGIPQRTNYVLGSEIAHKPLNTKTGGTHGQG